jgi:hypothetical protein
LSIYWPLSSDSAKVHAAIEKLQADIEEVARGEGILGRFQYVNYATTAWQRDAIRGYGEGEVRRLKSVARKYDPGCVFQKRVPGGFKIPV